MKAEEIDEINKMIESVKREIEYRKFGIKNYPSPLECRIAEYHRLKGIFDLLLEQAEILTVLKNHAKIVTPMMGPHEPEYYQEVRIIVAADDEKMPLIRKWLEEGE